jgi:CheY-like chemotaxis protein
MNSEVKYVLYADDDYEDRETLIEMIDSVPGDLKVVCVDNGLAAIEYLDGLESGEVFPCFVLLDINMPVMNGLETLSFLKNHKDYNRLPVVMYTTSQEVNDRITAAALKADDFVIKPFQFVELEKLAHRFAGMCEGVTVKRK